VLYRPAKNEMSGAQIPRAPGTSWRAHSGTASKTFPHSLHLRRSVEQNIGTSFSANRLEAKR
jgi:hypothetical protein